MRLERIVYITAGIVALGAHCSNVVIGGNQEFLSANGFETLGVLAWQVSVTGAAQALWFNLNNFSLNKLKSIYENTKNGLAFGTIATVVEYAAGRVADYGLDRLGDKF